MTEFYRWPSERAADLRDGLTPREIVEALYAPATLRLDNRVPAREPTISDSSLSCARVRRKPSRGRSAGLATPA